MSISAALSNALSGLTAVSRGTEVISSNLANKLTPGYGARELILSSRSLIGNGGGVKIEGVARLVPAALLADNRIASSSLGYSSTLHRFSATMESAAGTAQQGDSLTNILTAFDSALATAAASPDSEVRLQSAVKAADALANKINSIAMELQKARTIADKGIENDVSRLNSALGEVARLNRLVTIAQAKGQDASSLIDARQATIDSISDIIPIQEIPRAGGTVALFTKGGAPLLDGMKPAEIGFRAASIVTPQMSVSSGQLGTLIIDGVELTQGQMVMFKGGSLEANLKLRDEIAPEYQAALDSIAKDLYDRMADPAVDPTLSSGDAGLFTDRQFALDPANLLGFANRISLNNAVNPAKDGQLWRMRDGIQASQAGSVGNSSTLSRMKDALTDPRPTPGDQTGANRTLLRGAMDILSQFASDRLRAETSLQHDKAYANTMQASLLAHGVDSDKEMENLLQLEKAYAANAKAIQALTDMLDTILRIK